VEFTIPLLLALPAGVVAAWIVSERRGLLAAAGALVIVLSIALTLGLLIAILDGSFSRGLSA
jgi:hypothetical protein